MGMGHIQLQEKEPRNKGQGVGPEGRTGEGQGATAGSKDHEIPIQQERGIDPIWGLHETRKSSNFYPEHMPTRNTTVLRTSERYNHMSLRQQIVNYLQSKGEPTGLQEIYKQFPEEPDTTIRGRIYEELGKKITKIKRGVYAISANGAVGIIEAGDGRTVVFEMVKNEMKYDMVYFDIPYKAAGQRGGNRNIAKFPLISVMDFWKIIKQTSKIVRDEDSQIYFIITEGKTSKYHVDYYTRCVAEEFKLAARGYWQKIERDGRNSKLWGETYLPREQILVYSKSGRLRQCDDIFNLEYREQRVTEYPTQKPRSILRQIVKQSTLAGEFCLDLFAGSLGFHKSCLELGRNCHSVEIQESVIQRFI